MLKLSNLISLPFRYLQYLRGGVHPLWCTFGVTENCNARCQYCQYWKKNHNDLSTKEIFHVLRQLKKLGIDSVVFSGGESLLREDIVDIVRETTALGMQSVVVTNGVIGSKELYHDLMASGLQGIAFSLDGSKASIHETFRKGCPFDIVTQSIRSCVEVRETHGFKTSIAITSVVSNNNCNDLSNIVAFSKTLGVDKSFFQPIWPIFGEKDFSEKFGFSDFKEKELGKIVDELVRIPGGNFPEYYHIIPDLYNDFDRIKDRYQCFAGRAFVYVDSHGMLFPCSPLVNEPMGSLLTQSVEEIKGQPGLKNRLKSYKEFQCGGCTMSCYMEKNIAFSKLYNPMSLWKRVK